MNNTNQIDALDWMRKKKRAERQGAGLAYESTKKVYMDNSGTSRMRCILDYVSMHGGYSTQKTDGKAISITCELRGALFHVEILHGRYTAGLVQRVRRSQAEKEGRRYLEANSFQQFFDWITGILPELEEEARQEIGL